MASVGSEKRLCHFTQNITAKAALCVNLMVGDMGHSDQVWSNQLYQEGTFSETKSYKANSFCLLFFFFF